MVAPNAKKQFDAPCQTLYRVIPQNCNIWIVMSRGSWHWVPPVLEELLEDKEVRVLAKEIGKSPELLYGVLNGKTRTARLSTVQTVKEKLAEIGEGVRAERLFRKRDKSKG